MDFWQIVTLFLGSSALAAVVSGLVGVWVNKRNLEQQRDVLDQQRLIETTRLMLDLMATAHGAPTDGRTGIGVGQQIAAVQMIATIGQENPLYRRAAASFLSDLAQGSKLTSSRVEQLNLLQEAAARADAELTKTDPA